MFLAGLATVAGGPALRLVEDAIAQARRHNLLPWRIELESFRAITLAGLGRADALPAARAAHQEAVATDSPILAAWSGVVHGRLLALRDPDAARAVLEEPLPTCTPGCRAPAPVSPTSAVVTGGRRSCWAGPTPHAEVVGYDADGPSIIEAREHAAAAGARVSFVEADATGLHADGLFDAVLLLECLHDLARPVESLASCRKALADGGTVIVVDENVAPEFTAPGDLTERIMYGWSISHCLPAAMAEQPSAALGTVLREDAVRSLAATAGFGRAEVVDVDAGFFRIYRLEG